MPPSPPPKSAATPGAAPKRSLPAKVASVMIGWFILPFLCLAAVFGLGVHCGANDPQGVPERWIVGLADWWLATPDTPSDSTTPSATQPDSTTTSDP